MAKYWGLGIGDWGLGIGDWPQSPIPNPQSPSSKNKFESYTIIKIQLINYINLNKFLNNILS